MLTLLTLLRLPTAEKIGANKEVGLSIQTRDMDGIGAWHCGIGAWMALEHVFRWSRATVTCPLGLPQRVVIQALLRQQKSCDKVQIGFLDLTSLSYDT